jgi:ABC-2 type transport system permease protein
MNSQPATAPAVDSPASRTRPFYWSVRRELWENRSLYIAPLIVAGVVVVGFIFTAIGLPERRRAILLLDDPVKQRAAIEMPYDMAAMMIMFTAFIVGVFYCLDALHGERRDRSILFWKSLPVSDLTAVLAKVTVPSVIVPAVSFVVIVITQFIMLLVSSIALARTGLSGTTWENFNLLRQSVILFYSLVALSLWHLPIYGWALLVSSWVRRAAFLWAVLPLLAIGFFEKITFGTSYFGAFLKQRFFGFAETAFDFQGRTHPTIDSFAQLTPGHYLATPGLWLGLVVAAAFLFAAIRFRRARGPL